MIARIPSRSLKTGLAIAALAVALAGCTGDKWGFPYKAGVQQGNWITQEQVALLQPGMTREQVRFALGSPTLTSVLHANRWDYPYYYKPGYGEAQERKFTVWFENDRLTRWEGDKQPDLQPYQINTPSATADEKADKRLSEDEARLKQEEEQKKRDAAAPHQPDEPIPRPARQRARAAALNPRIFFMRIAIAGASGRMGQMLIDAVLKADGLQLAVALDRKGSPSLGQDAGAPLGQQTGVAITDDLGALANADCLIDFTRPEGTLEHLQACARLGVKAVIGTTGFDDNGRAAIEVAAQKTAIVFAPNMSVGVNATLKLLDMAARILNSGYDVEVFEAHHRNKVDAPSGTALKMGETIASAWDVALPDVATWSRHGDTGVRKPGTIGFSVLRGGDIVGDHTVSFCGIGERIEITHRSASRATYAEGALRAARFLEGKHNGLYDMQAVLGL